MKNLFMLFSFKSYSGITRERHSNCVKFFFILVLVLSVLMSLQFTLYAKNKLLPQLNFFINNMLAQLSDGFPETVIQNGQLVSPRETFIRDFKDKEFSFAFIIEPDEGKTQELLDRYQSCVMLTRSKIITKSLQQGERTKIEMVDLKKVSFAKIVPLRGGFKIIGENKREFIFTSETIGHALNKIMFFVWPVSFLFFCVYFCIAKPIQLLFFSLVSLLMNAISSAGLAYKDLLAVGVYALAPPSIAVAMLQVLFGGPFPGQAFIFVCIYSLYLWQGIRANKTGTPVSQGAV